MIDALRFHLFVCLFVRFVAAAAIIFVLFSFVYLDISLIAFFSSFVIFLLLGVSYTISMQ